MADGQVHHGEGRAEGWREIVHRDTKPGNIFLSHPDPRRYPQYPRPLLGDFGLAFKIAGPEDPTNPECWVEAGTEGFWAPEQVRYFGPLDWRAFRSGALSAQTNIYAIGTVMSHLMLMPLGEIRQPIWLGDGAPEHTLYDLRLPEQADGFKLESV